MRTSKRCRIDFADVSFTRESMIIDLRKSKTDRESSGRKVGIQFGRDRRICPVRALRLWLKQARIKSGPLFRPVNRHCQVGNRAPDKDSVRAILKTAAKRARMMTKPLAGHSLHACCVTQAPLNGVNGRDIMRQTGNKSPAMLSKYIREGRCSRTTRRLGWELAPGLAAEEFGFKEIGKVPGSVIAGETHISRAATLRNVCCPTRAYCARVAQDPTASDWICGSIEEWRPKGFSTRSYLDYPRLIHTPAHPEPARSEL